AGAGAVGTVVAPVPADAGAARASDATEGSAMPTPTLRLPAAGPIAGGALALLIAAAALAQPETVETDAGTIAVEPLASGLAHPWGMTFLPRSAERRVGKER